MVAIRMFAATYRGRMKEAAELAADFQARALALSRPQSAGSGIMQLAISEALVGLTDRAKARIDKAEEDGILGDEHRRRPHGGGGDREGWGRWRAQLMPAALEGQQEDRRLTSRPAPKASARSRRWRRWPKARPAEAAALIEPVVVRCRAHRYRQHLDASRKCRPATGRRRRRA